MPDANIAENAYETDPTMDVQPSDAGKSAPVNRRFWCGWFDGCSLSNPGPSGIGCVLVAPYGERFEIAEPIGQATNNTAEYKALIAVMGLAFDEGCRSLLVQGDSQIVLNQVFGTMAVSSPHLQALHKEARQLVEQFEEVRFEWIRREHNTAADVLSKAGAAKPFVETQAIKDFEGDDPVGSVDDQVLKAMKTPRAAGIKP